MRKTLCRDPMVVFRDRLSIAGGGEGGVGGQETLFICISGSRKYGMFSIYSNYVTLRDVIHLCQNNDTYKTLHLTCVGILCRVIPFFSWIQSKHTIHTLFWVHIFQGVGDLFFSPPIEIFVLFLIRLGLHLKKFSMSFFFWQELILKSERQNLMERKLSFRYGK